MTLRVVALVVLLISIPVLHVLSERLLRRMYERVYPPNQRSYWQGSPYVMRYALWLKYRRLGLPATPLVAALVLHATTIVATLLVLWLLARSV